MDGSNNENLNMKDVVVDVTQELTTLELKPNNLLMVSDFDGYKLSLEEIPFSRKNLAVSVDRAFLTSEQYSLLHTKLFALHNHLFSNQFDLSGGVYFFDKDLNIWKCYIYSLTNEFCGPIEIFSVPKVRDRKLGDYNATLHFASEHHVVVSDGMGTIYILGVKPGQDQKFEQLFSGKILTDIEQSFIISDALYDKSNRELHILFLHIQEDIDHHFTSVIHWVTLKEFVNNDNLINWEQVEMRQLRSKGQIQYLHLEENCDHIYVVSEDNLEFLMNSKFPIQSDDVHGKELNRNSYNWSQTSEDINIVCCLPENAKKDLLKINTEDKKVEIVYNFETLVSGELQANIDPSLTTWEMKSDNKINVTLVKQEGSGMWRHLFISEQNSRNAQLNQGMQGHHASGLTFNSQEIEECDFENEKLETFERISGATNKTTHRIHLGTNPVLLCPRLNPKHCPSLGIRHDIDVCLWQPTLEEGSFHIRHEGTLLAFGYVQASKQNRKFLTCSPNMEYAVISEYSGHIFIYRQNKPVLSSELKNRSSGRKIKNIAQQQVFNLAQQEILGLYASNTHLFILGESFILALDINCDAV